MPNNDDDDDGMGTVGCCVFIILFCNYLRKEVVCFPYAKEVRVCHTGPFQALLSFSWLSSGYYLDG